MGLHDERDKLFREQNKLITNIRPIDWQFNYRPLTCIVIGCNNPEVTPGLCAEHAAMINAECDRLDNLRKERNMPISLFTWLNHRWLIPPAILLLTPFAVWHYIGQVEMIYWSFGEVVGIFIAQFVRKWRELN